MYAIYAYIDHLNHPNVGIYGIHGVSGIYGLIVFRLRKVPCPTTLVNLSPVNLGAHRLH